MRWWDWLLGLNLWRPYLAALWQSCLHPRERGRSWCHDPKRCPRKHRLVIVMPPGKPMRLGLKHLEGV